VNNYIKEISGGTFTAKDFRTWAGTLHAIEAFKEIGCCDNVTEIKKNIVTALDIVAKQLGNTRSVCKKYYVHPTIIDLYSNNLLTKYLDKLVTTVCSEDESFSPAECVLMNIMEDCSAPVIAA
jgi:DNA topoisomerase I